MLGFVSPREMEQAPRRPRTTAELMRLSAEARAVRADASSAVALARRRGVSLDDATFEVGVSIQAVMWWFPDAIGERPERGVARRLMPTAADAGLRLRPVAVDDQVTFVPALGSVAADRLASIFDVQWRWIQGRASESELAQLPATLGSGRRVVRDPAKLDELARQGAFDLADVYRELFG